MDTHTWTENSWQRSRNRPGMNEHMSVANLVSQLPEEMHFLFILHNAVFLKIKSIILAQISFQINIRPEVFFIPYSVMIY